ncbi:hypothetical protein B498_3271 [Enterobacter sp. SST3]|nr:hypothetical protein B498_3271 [Enterobacter sp. SST3]
MPASNCNHPSKTNHQRLGSIWHFNVRLWHEADIGSLNNMKSIKVY